MATVTRVMNIIYSMWLRDMLKFWRSKSRIIGALSAPLTFMVFLGPGLSSGFRFQGGGAVDISFFAPGFISMSVLFAALFSGASIIFERELGILKEILITPASRLFVALGKVSGGVTIAMIQGVMMLIIATFIGVRYTSLAGVAIGIIVMFTMGAGFVGLGITLASKFENHEGFQMIMSFLTMPLVMLSGAFFPISDLPIWLKSLVYINPLTYGVEALRWCLLGNSTIPMLLSITIMTLFAVITLGAAGRSFGKMRI